MRRRQRRESFDVSIREAAINFWEVTGMLTEDTIFLTQSLHLAYGRRLRCFPLLARARFLESPCFWATSERFFSSTSPNLRDLMRGTVSSVARPINRYVTRCQLGTRTPVFVINPACLLVSRTMHERERVVVNNALALTRARDGTCASVRTRHRRELHSREVSRSNKFQKATQPCSS